jgi:hypothetical protein
MHLIQPNSDNITIMIKEEKVDHFQSAHPHRSDDMRGGARGWEYEPGRERTAAATAEQQWSLGQARKRKAGVKATIGWIEEIYSHIIGSQSEPSTSSSSSS